MRRIQDELLESVLAGRYRLVRLHEDAAVGTVFVAADLQQQRDVYLKLLPRNSPEALNLPRLQIVASAVARSVHPHLAEVSSVGIGHGRPFVATTIVEGETLRDRLDACGPCTAMDAMAITTQLLDALAVAHESGLIHGNVKPSNVLLTSARGTPASVLLLDLGVTELLGVGGAAHLQSAAVGTAPYLSPEQLGGVRELDARVDIWSTALVFHEALTNRRAFDGATLQEVSSRMAFHSAPVVGVPGIDRVIHKALARRRDERYRTAADFRTALLDACLDAWSEGPDSKPRGR